MPRGHNQPLDMNSVGDQETPTISYPVRLIAEIGVNLA